MLVGHILIGYNIMAAIIKPIIILELEPIFNDDDDDDDRF